MCVDELLPPELLPELLPPPELATLEETEAIPAAAFFAACTSVL